MKHSTRRLALPATVLAGALSLTACGGTDSAGPSASSSSSSMQGMDHGASGTASSATGTASTATGTTAPRTPAPGPHNEADVTFATQMIPHHAQAVEMADMALARAGSSEVKSLAEAIKAAQGPEIRQMSGWLAGWGAAVPATGGGHDMGSMGGSMEGMMSEQDMTAMGQASGTAFDRMWLTGMTGHHRGAVTMAETELEAGANAEAKELATAIIDAQTREIAQMQKLLAALPQ